MAVLRERAWYSLKFMAASCSSFILVPAEICSPSPVGNFKASGGCPTLMQYFLGDPVGGMPVPQRGDLPLLAFTRQDELELGQELLQFRTDQDVRPHADGDGTFGGGAQGETRDAQASGLLLDTARIGDDDRGVFFQGKEVKVPQRFQKADRSSGLRSSRS